MEQLKALLNKIPYLAIVAVVVAYLGYDYWDFLKSPTSPLGQKKSQARTLKEQNVALVKKWQDAQEFLRSLEAKKTELRTLAQELSEKKDVLSEDLDFPSLLTMIGTEAKRVGVKVMGLKPAGVKEAEMYIEHAFEMQFRGVFAQVVVFLQRISSAKRILRTDGIVVKPIGSPDVKYVELEGTFNIKAFRYAVSKADQKAKQITESYNAPEVEGGSQ